MDKLRIFEAFAGMGAQRKALDNINADYSISGLAEWYVPAIISYESIHNGLKINKEASREECVKFLSAIPLSMNSKSLYNPNLWKSKNLNDLRVIYSAVKQSKEHGNIFDVTRLHERKLADVDVLTYSFPCQDLSQQGKGKGMTKDSGTRSGLLWEIEKALEATPKDKLPKYLLMENVKAITHKVNKKDMDQWIKKLGNLGYSNDLKVLNSGDFGSPQARRRAFMLSTRKDIEASQLPDGDKKPKAIKSILDKVINEKDILKNLSTYELSAFGDKTRSNIKKASLLDYSTFNSETYVYDPNFTGPTLTASGANSRIKIHSNGHIRKINAREAYKYMGFTANDFKKVDKHHNIVSQTKMIFTCGNSISVEVLEEIFRVICSG